MIVFPYCPFRFFVRGSGNIHYVVKELQKRGGVVGIPSKQGMKDLVLELTILIQNQLGMNKDLMVVCETELVFTQVRIGKNKIIAMANAVANLYSRY